MSITSIRQFINTFSRILENSENNFQEVHPKKLYQYLMLLCCQLALKANSNKIQDLLYVVKNETTMISVT